MAIPRFNPQDTLILVALEEELPPHQVPGWNVRYTGVGKVNAALAAAAHCPAFRPAALVNYGSAGALKPGLQGLVEATEFHQRDMDARPMGFALGQTPFEDAAPLSLNRPGLSCGTGDSFLTAPPELRTDIVDMEAYALAKYALRHGLDFHCFKYISDMADGNAPEDWRAGLARGAELFRRQVLEPGN